MAEDGKKPPLPADEVPAGVHQEPFLARWSRRKEEAKQAPPEPVLLRSADLQAAAPPELPPLDKLTLESDYRAFFHPKVDEGVRRAALKKLFSDPHFNVMDGLDVYIDDYSKTEPIPAAMLAGLRQAQKILEWAKDDADQRKKEEAQKAASEPLQALDRPPVPDSPSPSEIGFEDHAPDPLPAEPGGAATH